MIFENRSDMIFKLILLSAFDALRQIYIAAE